MPTDPARVKSVFLAASDLSDPAARAAHLDRECGADADLRARVEALLRADEAPAAPAEAATGTYEPDADQSHAAATATFDPDPATGSFVDVPPGRDRPAPADTGTVIAGRYTLARMIGEGGMGTVYLAEQTEPVRRQVVLKLIKPGMDSKAVLARFDAERQALALMDHPNIARVYDGGTTAAGQPFFVMELVAGVPLTAYCDARRLSVDARLQLFVAVCQAVQHAHQKGIIHRDLKPGNVLVTEVDGRPTPKVIDFGVAKATDHRLTDLSLADTGAIVGTPAYMSPEQADPATTDIDTRTDVYALGVMLYELLTGSPPIDARQFRRGAVLEMLRMVREVDPPRPSTKLSTADALPNIAANRGIDPARLARLLRGELDWVVMKALDKDRARRYDTANGLARDVQRYLANEVVEARPPSRGYRLRKFARRHKGQVVAAGLVAFALLAGIVGTTIGWVEAREQKRLADDRADGERAAKLDAQEKEQLAVAAAEKERRATELTAARLKQIELINGTVFEIFAGFDVRKLTAGKDTVESVLARKLVEAGRQLDEKAIHDPLVLAGLRHRLGRTLMSLGEDEAAIGLFIKARETRAATLGADHPDTLISMGSLADGYRVAGKLDLALPLYVESLRIMKSTLGTDHSDTLTGMNNLAVAYDAAGKRELSLPLKEEVLRLGKAKQGADHPDTLTHMNNLAASYYAAGKLDLALPLFEETLRLMKAKLGADHPDTLTGMSNLASVYEATGKRDLALPLKEETLKRTKARLGAGHPDTLLIMNNLAASYYAAGKLDLALPLLEETLKHRKAKQGADHPDTLLSMNNLAAVNKAAGKPELALPLFEETLKLRKAKLGADHPDTLVTMNNLAESYHTAGKLDLALPLYEEALKLRKAKQGADHPDTLVSMNNLAAGYRDLGKHDAALALQKEAAAGFERRRFQHQYAGRIVTSLITSHERLEQFDQAEAWRRKWLAVLKERSGADPLPYADALAALGLNLIRQKKWSAAEPVLRESLDLRAKTPGALAPGSPWQLFDTQSLLGGALLGQKKYAAAEPLLLRGYEGLKAREKTIPPPGVVRIPAALDRLVDLYMGTNKPEEAKKWRAERAKYPEIAPPPRVPVVRPS